MDGPGGTSANEREQFTDVFRTYYPHLMSYVRRRVPADCTPDIVENAFLAAWRHVGELPAEPLPWLYRAASFEIRNWRRSESRVQRDLHLATSLLDEGYLVADTADEVASADRWTTAFAGPRLLRHGLQSTFAPRETAPRASRRGGRGARCRRPSPAAR
jgi:DNA-directed RNA polymerase specialized sigma24 family protein